MKTISVTLSRDFDEIIIVPFADEHDGDPFANEALTEDRLAFVERTPNAFAVLNGDLMNVATKNSKSDSYSAKYTPQEQRQRALKRYGRIKDKIIGITDGNHCDRVYLESGVNIMQCLAVSLGLEARYSHDGLYIFLRLGETTSHKETRGTGKHRQICYRIYMNHGGRGGRSAGSKVNALTEMSSIVRADVYFHSHTHMPVIIPDIYSEPDDRNSIVLDKPCLYVNTAAALGRGGYGEKKEYKPLSNRMPVVYLNGRRKHIDADFGRGCGLC